MPRVNAKSKKLLQRSADAAETDFGTRLHQPKIREFVKGQAPIFRGLSKLPVQQYEVGPLIAATAVERYCTV